MLTMEQVERYIELSNAGLIPFKCLSGVKPFPNQERIHSLKQREVSEIVSRVKNAKIIIFGSSITGRCRFSSDLDVGYITTKENERNVCSIISAVTNGNADFLNIEEIHSPTLKENIMKGVVVYDDISESEIPPGFEDVIK